MRPLGSLQILGYDLSDEGVERSVNEDAVLLNQELGIYAVADGAGGLGKGDVAAQLALKTIENYIGSSVRSTLELGEVDVLGNYRQARRLSSALHRAQNIITESCVQRPELKGMATTVVAALFNSTNHQLHLAWVGNSRAYRLRHGHLELLTQDHTIASDLLERRPDIADDVLENLPQNSIVRALGMEQELRVSVRTIPVVNGDRFLLCTDGLSHHLHSDEIAGLMNRNDELSHITSELMAHAIDGGSRDNISVLVLEAEEIIVGDEVPTARYHEIPLEHPDSLSIPMRRLFSDDENIKEPSLQEELESLTQLPKGQKTYEESLAPPTFEHLPELAADRVGFEPPPISSSSLNDSDPSGALPPSEEEWTQASRGAHDPLQPSPLEPLSESESSEKKFL